MAAFFALSDTVYVTIWGLSKGVTTLVSMAVMPAAPICALGMTPSTSSVAFAPGTWKAVLIRIQCDITGLPCRVTKRSPSPSSVITGGVTSSSTSNSSTSTVVSSIWDRHKHTILSTPLDTVDLHVSHTRGSLGSDSSGRHSCAGASHGFSTIMRRITSLAALPALSLAEYVSTWPVEPLGVAIVVSSSFSPRTLHLTLLPSMLSSGVTPRSS
mmetsp:Transcript_36352/g.69751  ORF Transcript_36352/g.69751 Transcript_36352/m.69751 type:complete len:213 (+) Transcript_36352:2684-3322(+)